MDYDSMRPLVAVLLIFLALLAILWFCLPFAVFGTQPLIKELIVETKKTNELLSQIAGEKALKPIQQKTEVTHNEIVVGG